ncbi:MAG: hypothetical protein M3Y57_13125 [Acidobacteriota bacterium]|nr:hypothetical protein [Acidobacteriota bacterium]
MPKGALWGSIPSSIRNRVEVKGSASIPSNIARQVYTQLKTQRHVHRAQLGIVAQTISDAVYAVNRRVVNGVSQLREILNQMKSGQAAVLLVEREGHLMYVPIALD